MSTAPQRKYTPEEYLTMEEVAEYRSEYYQGEIFAMAGGTPNHNRISRNILGAFHQQLRNGKNCEAFGADQRIKVSRSGLYTYADVVVGCGKLQYDDVQKTLLMNPKLIVEVLSQGTESYDRGKKFEMYRHLPSLDEYVLASQFEPHIERFVRQAEGSWLMTEAKGLESSLTFAAIGCTLRLADAYEGIDFEMGESAAHAS